MLSLRLHCDPADSGRRAEQGAVSGPLLSLERRERPSAGAGELLLRVAYCGICGSDFAMARALPGGAMEYRGLCRLPVTPGHEFSAWVEAGARFPKGTAVVAEESMACGACAGCRAARGCLRPEKIGFTRDGAFAGWLVVPEASCWSLERLVEAVGGEQAMRLGALVQPYAIALSLFEASGAPPPERRDTLLVAGAGPIGLSAIDWARSRGLTELYVWEKDPERLALALRLGARPWAGGELRWLVDSTGSPRLHERARFAPRGVFVRLAKGEGAASPEQIRRAFPGELTLSEPDGHAVPDAYPRVIEALARGELRAGLLIDRVVGLREALRCLREQERGLGKILVAPGEEQEC